MENPTKIGEIKSPKQRREKEPSQKAEETKAPEQPDEARIQAKNKDKEHSVSQLPVHKASSAQPRRRRSTCAWKKGNEKPKTANDKQDGHLVVEIDDEARVRTSRLTCSLPCYPSYCMQLWPFLVPAPPRSVWCGHSGGPTTPLLTPHRRQARRMVWRRVCGGQPLNP